MSTNLRTGSMLTRTSTSATAATAAAKSTTATAAEWTLAGGSGDFSLREFDAGDDDVAFLQAVGNFGGRTVADSGPDANGLRRGFAVRSGGQQVNRARGWG